MKLFSSTCLEWLHKTQTQRRYFKHEQYCTTLNPNMFVCCVKYKSNGSCSFAQRKGNIYQDNIFNILNILPHEVILNSWNSVKRSLGSLWNAHDCSVCNIPQAKKSIVSWLGIKWASLKVSVIPKQEWGKRHRSVKHICIKETATCCLCKLLLLYTASQLLGILFLKERNTS